MIFIPQYKNKFLRILILTPFLILGGFIFCSCENFGIKSMDIGMYLMIPSGIEKENIEIFINQESSKIYQAYSSTENKAKFIESFEIGNEDISKTDFLKEFNKTNNDVIYVSNSNYIESNKNYKDTFLIKIKTQENIEEYIYIFEKDCLQAMKGTDFIDISFETESYRTIHCLLYYYYTVSI